MLDEVFLGPPRPAATSIVQQRRYTSAGPQSWRCDTNNMTSSRYTAGVEGNGQMISPRNTRLLAADSGQYSKMNVHHLPPGSGTASGVLVHHHSSSSPIRLKTSSNCSSQFSKRKESPMDMHSYSISVDSLLHGSNHSQSPMASRCVNIHQGKSSSSSLGYLQGSQGSLISCPSQTRFSSHGIPSGTCSAVQQRFSSHGNFPVTPSNSSHTEPAMSMCSKMPSHHLYPTRSPAGSSNTPRVYQGSIGPGPLITSLSPLRGTSKTGGSSGAGGPVKTYSPHCQMVPYRQHLHMTSSGNAHSYRKTAHTIPIR